MRKNDFEENKVIQLIFKQFWSRNHRNKLDRLTPQDSIVYSLDLELVSSIVDCSSSCKSFAVSRFQVIVANYPNMCDIRKWRLDFLTSNQLQLLHKTE